MPQHPSRVPPEDKEDMWLYSASGGDPQRAEHIERHWPLSKVIHWYWLSTIHNSK